MSGWFGKPKSQTETTPSGASVIRYPLNKWASPLVGDADKSAPRYNEARNNVYAKLFGEPSRVFETGGPHLPRVEVRAYKRRSKDGAETCAMVTSGMSDLPMNAPEGAEEFRRVELIFYCSEPRQEFADTMRFVAHFPHDQNTWIHMGHTIPNGTPPAPFWGSAVLDTVLLMPTIVTKDRRLPEELVLDGDRVEFLWVVPISAKECDLKLREGLDAILSLFGRHRHPHVFDPNRSSYV